MPPEIKKVVSKISDISCRNCIHSALFQTGISCNRYPGVGYLINPNYFCGDGNWLYFGTWWGCETSPEELHCMDYAALYGKFAEKAGLMKNL